MEDRKTLTYVLYSIIKGIKVDNEVILEPQMSIKRLADLLEMKHNTVSNRIKRANNITFSNLVEMLNKLGYEIVIQKKTKGARKDGSFYIDDDGNWQYYTKKGAKKE